MAKKSRGHRRYQPAPWSADFDALKRGGVAPWYRDKHDAKGKAKPVPRGGRR